MCSSDLNRAAYYLETQEYAKGLADIEESLNRNPLLAEVYLLRGNIYDRLGDLPQTLADYNQALDLHLAYPDEQRKLFNNRGNVYSRLGQDDLALADYNKALALDPTDLFALLNRGLVEEAGQDHETGAHLYRTTTYFLERIGVTSLDELPELAPYLPDMADLEDELAEMVAAPVATETTPEPGPAGEPGQPHQPHSPHSGDGTEPDGGTEPT